MKFTKNQNYSYIKLSNCIRILAADAVEKAFSGHPGMVLGMADVMTILVFNHLKFNPKEPKWTNRDRLVLSAGHGSMLLYAFYYLTDYKDFTLDDIKQFRQLHSKCAGHPEYGNHPAIEITTGPLGQGFAASVGMAIAEKKYKQQLGNQIIDHKIYCIVGDGCLMEGISYEAASLAGHLKLNNLIVLFDDNQISIDGPINLTVSENHKAKFEALGWETEVVDGHDFSQIDAALERANKAVKPYFIACKTQIGKGCNLKAGSEQSHGSPLGKSEISFLKNNINVKDEPFCIEEELKDLWEKAWLKNSDEFLEWQHNYDNLAEQDLQYLMLPTFNQDLLNELTDSSKPEATRSSAGKIIEYILTVSNKIICGSADLSISTNTKNSQTKPITADDYSGNFIYYGVRENAMAAIMNGLAVSGFLPIGGTFFVFSDYMRPGIRLAALMGLKIIYIMTHDSIGVGEDGPTHQPVEHLASFRAMPNLLVFRPADAVETLRCFEVALANETGPSMLVLTRQNVPQLNIGYQISLQVRRGAYIANASESEPQVTIYATGSELSIAFEVKNILRAQNIQIEIISVPCFSLFFLQPQDYIDSMLTRDNLKVAIEAGADFGWHRFVGNEGLVFGVQQFGHSAPADKIYEYLGLSPDIIAEKIIAKLQNLNI